MKYFISILLLFPILCFCQNISLFEQKADSLFRISKYEDAIKLYNNILKVEKNTPIDSVRVLIKTAEIYYAKNQIENLAICNSILKNKQNRYFEINNDKHLSSYIMFLRGKNLELKQDYDSSGFVIDQAIKMRIKFKKDSLFAKMLGLRGFVYNNNNNYKKARLYYKLALRYYIINKVYDENIIRLLLNEAYIYWVQKNIEQYKKNIDMALRIIEFIPVDEEYITLSYMNLGVYYLYQLDYFNAYKSFNSIREKSIENQNYLAHTAFMLGDYKKSEAIYKSILSKIKQEDNKLKAYILFYYSYILHQNNKYKSTIKTLQECISVNTQGQIEEQHIDYLLASSFYKIGTQDSALFFINNSIEKFIVKNKTNPAYARSILLKGKILNNLKSNNFYDKAKKTISNQQGKKKNTIMAFIFKEIGKINFKNKLYHKALNDFQQTFISADKDFYSLNIFDNPECKNVVSFVNLANALRYKSETLEQIYLQNDSLPYLIASFETAKLLIEQVEKMLRSYPLFESKQFLLENSANSYSRAQHLAYLCWQKTGEQKYKDEVLQISEKSRVAILMAQLQENEFNSEILTDSLSQKLKNIEQDIAYLIGQINENTDKKSLTDKLNNDLFELQEKKNTIIESYKGKYGNFSNYFKQKPKIDFNKLLLFPKANQIVLEYSLCDSIILLNVIQKGKHDIFEIQYDNILKQKLENYKRFLVPNKLNLYKKKSIADINKIGEYLYHILIAPAKKMTEGKQLLIVQESKLGFIPFEAFVVNDKYLIEQHAISYIYSMNVTRESIKHTPKNRENRMLAIFPEYNFEKLNDNIPSKKHYKYLASLNSKKESAILLDIVDCDIIMKQNATEENFKNLSGNYSIMHLSLHSILDTSNYLLSKLCFTPTVDSLNDGLFNICDVAPLKLNSLLTVLSGCNTGTGQLISGEGAMSFARSFILAGSRSILMSLWELDNNSAIKINTGFYQYLTEGFNKTEALQLSKNDYLKNADPFHKHPFFWSGFVLIGDTESIELPQYNSIIKNISIIVFIFLLIIGISLFLRKRYGFCWSEALKDKFLRR